MYNGTIIYDKYSLHGFLIVIYGWERSCRTHIGYYEPDKMLSGFFYAYFCVNAYTKFEGGRVT